jgi:hypothetical protein
MSRITFWNKNKSHIVYEFVRDLGGDQTKSVIQETNFGESQTSPNIWSRERFPVVYEGDEAKAVLVDVVSFAQIELILDNLFNREAELEEAVLTASNILEQLIVWAQKESPSTDWEKELNELRSEMNL